jgi:sialate O-acetylesterase
MNPTFARRTTSLVWPALALLSCAGMASADVKPAPLFSDHMVLQSGMSVPVWGGANPGEKVTVSLNGQTQSATTGADGKWMVRLTDLKAGGPFEMTIAGANTVTVKDVLVGEVWIGSGQSNMAFTVSKAKARYAGLVNEEEVIKAANFPKVRVFMGKEATSYDPLPVVQGEWQVCSPETVPGFSAVAYLFGRNLDRRGLESARRHGRRSQAEAHARRS